LTKRLENMASVADFASEFARRANSGAKPSTYVAKQHVESFLLVLAREGFAFAREALDQITDPDIRKIVETIFFSTVGGAIVGGVVGGFVAGPPGAQVGTIIGGAAGFAAGCIAVTITAAQKGDGLQITIA
jgi:hypothetical protein